MISTSNQDVEKIIADSKVNNIDVLPPELLLKCFCYLKTKHMQTVALVCKQWLDVASIQTLWFSFYKKINEHALMLDAKKDYKALVRNNGHNPHKRGVEVKGYKHKSCFRELLTPYAGVGSILSCPEQVLLILEELAEIDEEKDSYIYYFSAFSLVPTKQGWVLEFLSASPETSVYAISQPYNRFSFKLDKHALQQVEKHIQFKIEANYIFDRNDDLVESLKQILIKYRLDANNASSLFSNCSRTFIEITSRPKNR